MFKKFFSKTQFDDNLNRTNFIRNRIKMVEKYFPRLGKAFYEYIDKNARSRNCIDKIAVILRNYGKAEKVTSCFEFQMNDLANILLDVGTERDAQVKTMETEVLEQLNEYDKLCALVQMELKLSLIASKKERNWLRQLNKAKINHPEDLQRICLAEAEVLKARGESVRSNKNLEEQIDFFEMKRLNALKEILLSWTLAELKFHSRALQLFTNAYCLAANMDVSSDLEKLRNELKSTEDTPGSDSGIGSKGIFHLIPTFQEKMEFTGSRTSHVCLSVHTPQSSHLSSFQEEYI